MDPQVHLLVGLGIGLAVLLPELGSRRAVAAVGILGLAGVGLDADVLFVELTGVRFAESALVFFGVPAAVLAVAIWRERGSSNTLFRTFSVGLMAVLPAQVILDAAKGHEVPLYYPLSSTTYGLAFAEPGVAYSGTLGAVAVVAMMTAAAACVARMVVAECRQASARSEAHPAGDCREDGKGSSDGRSGARLLAVRRAARARRGQAGRGPISARRAAASVA